MGGGVGFESTPGQGSVFWVELPLYVRDRTKPSQTPVPGAIRTALSSATGPTFRIVYIEDNPSNIAFMQAMMDELPSVALTTVPTAEVGIEVVRDTQPHVVIMDINLPGMSGYDATRRLREWPETKHIPVIALTAAAMLSDRKRLGDAGFFRYLTKPVKVSELLEALEQVFKPRQ
jgi:CheY-like chemotaxis protein